MNAEAPQKGRSGGRSARIAQRAAPLAEDIRPVRPGMEGGAYKPLNAGDMRAIYEAALTALETIGIADAPETGVEYMVAAGASCCQVVKLKLGVSGPRLCVISTSQTQPAQESEKYVPAPAPVPVPV